MDQNVPEIRKLAVQLKDLAVKHGIKFHVLNYEEERRKRAQLHAASEAKSMFRTVYPVADIVLGIRRNPNLKDAADKFIIKRVKVRAPQQLTFLDSGFDVDPAQDIAHAYAMRPHV